MPDLKTDSTLASRRAVVAGIVAASTTLLPSSATGADRGTKSGAGPIIIGILMPLTGAAGYTGIQTEEMARWWARRLNAIGGLTVGDARRQIEVLVADEGVSSDTATAAAQTLVQGGARFVVGPLMWTDAAGPVFESARCIYNPFMVGSRTSGSEMPHKLIYPPMPFWTAGWFRVVRRHHPEIATIAVIGTSDPHNQSVQATMESSAGQSGIRIVCNEVYPVGTTDFQAQVERILAAKPHSINICAQPHEAASLVAHLRIKGFGGWLQTNISREQLATMSPQHAVRLMTIVPDLTSPVHSERTRQLYRDFVTDNSAASWGLTSAVALDSLLMYEGAVRHAQSSDPAKLLATFDDPSFTYQSMYSPSARLGGLATYGVRRTLVSGCEYGEIIDHESIRFSSDIELVSVP